MSRRTIYNKKLSIKETEQIIQSLQEAQRQYDVIAGIVVANFGPGHQFAQRCSRLSSIALKTSENLIGWIGIFNAMAKARYEVAGENYGDTESILFPTDYPETLIVDNDISMINIAGEMGATPAI